MKGWARTCWGRLAILATSGVILGSCVVNPVTNRLQLSLISESQEIQLGEQTAREVIASIGLVDDPALQRYVADIGMQMAADSERPDLPWQFGVVDDASVNAFALPGGKIFITRGLIAHLDNEAQLAGVLGHEIGHVTARHSVTRISQAQLAELGFGVGAVLSPGVRELAPLVGVGLNLLFLRFSRRDEHQADELALRYAYRAEYDVAELADVFTTLEAVSAAQNGGRLPEWLSTHPSPEDRIERVMERVALVEAERPRLTVARQRYLRQIEGLPFGPDPRNGFFENGRFYHPALRFTVTFPEGWETANLQQAVVAASPAQDARIQVALDDAPGIRQALQRFAAHAAVTLTAQYGDPLPQLPSVAASFVARLPEGVLGGVVTFVELDQRVYQLLSLTPEPRLGSYMPVFQRTHETFARLTDPRMLERQPARLRLMRVPTAMSLAELYELRRPPVDLPTLVLLNQLEPGVPLEAGSWIKWVEGAALGAR